MRFNNLLIKVMCHTLIVTQAALGFHNFVWAAPSANSQYDSNYDVKVDGYNNGMDFLRQAQENVRKFNVSENGNITFGNERLDSITNEDGSAFNLNQLSPDAAHPENADQYYESGELPNLDDLKGANGISESQMDELGNASHEKLEADAESEDPTIQGMVFGVLNDTANANQPSFNNDPMLTNITTVLNGTNGNPFTDCDIDYQIMNMTQTTHNPELVKCVDQRTESCTISHHPVLALLKYSQGNAVYGTCGENCVSYFIGQFPYDSDDPLRPDSCEESEITTSLQIINQDAITQASIASIDYAGSVFAYMPSESTADIDKPLFGYDSDGDSILDASDLTCSSSNAASTAYPQADITSIIKNAQNGKILNFKIRYKGAVPYARLNVKFDPTKVATHDEWEGANQCLLNAEAISKGEMDGSIRCTAEVKTTNGKVYLAGIQLDPKYLNNSYGLSGSCTQAEVRVNLSSINDTAESNLNEQPLCKDLEDRGCGFVSSRCLKYGTTEDLENTCLLYQNTYDCGYANDIEVPQTVQQYDCPGAVACMGTDCLNIIIGSEDTEKDFSKAMGILQESQQAANDMSCTHTGRYDDNGNEIFDCKMFGGYADECRDSFQQPFEWLGAESCCTGGGVSGDWATLVRQTLQMSKIGAVKELANFNKLTGLAKDVADTGWFGDTAGISGMEGISAYGMGWDLFKNISGLGNTIDAVVSPISNALNNIIPYAGEVFTGITYYAQDVIVSYITEKYIVPAMMSAVDAAIGAAVGGTTGGSASAGAAAETTVKQWATDKLVQAGMSSQAAAQTVAMVSTAISVVGTIYAIYSAAKLVTSLLFACDESEYQLQSNIMVKKCDYVGNYCSKEMSLGITDVCVIHSNTYCCFESPLSRILNKQIKYALKGCGRVLWPDNRPSCAFGPDSEHPDCSPITVEQLEQVDWTQVDLTEWLELLKASDVLSSDDVSLSGLSDNFLPTGGYDQNGNKVQ